MCADDGRRSGLDDELRVIDPSGQADKSKAGGADAQNDRLEDSTRKTEMWKELWMKNVANADASTKHTSQFFSDSFNKLRTRLFRRWFSPNDHYEEVMFLPPDNVTASYYKHPRRKKMHVGAKDVICPSAHKICAASITNAFLSSNE